jgi:hypothetical protein
MPLDNLHNKYYFIKKCLRIERLARTTQATLKRMIVGSVFSVDDQIRAMLEAMANM